DRLSSLYRVQFGAAPGVAQLQVIVDDYIDDEVLYREALRLGLAEDDEIVRRRLIQKLEFLRRDSFSTSPSSAELRAYYNAHPDQFTTPARASFTQVFFSADHGGSNRALERAREARANWLTRFEIPEGDASSLEPEYSALTRGEVVRLFGESGLVDAAFAEP